MSKNKKNEIPLKTGNDGEEMIRIPKMALNDMRSPLRGISLLVDMIELDTKEKLNEETSLHLKLIKVRIKEMYSFIDSLQWYYTNDSSSRNGN